ncbi:hypothetical protein MKC46_04200 [[Clostridium] innocuum]|nr:hypothetical protein [[Clostridium] innocuum]
MRKKNILKIHLLGEFYMENKNYRFPQETKKSTQLILLIAYLMMYRHTVVSKEKLIKILWKEDESDKPEGVKEAAQQRESDILRDVITTELRKNDVFTKCSPFQYSLIIATTSMEGCDKAISRILDRFQQKKTIPETKLMYEYKHIN